MTSPAPPARFSAQTRLRALQSDIMELILVRELEAGDPLPTESELCLALGVGRNTLRESLKVLQALGVIEIRHGFGMFVAPSNFDALTDGLSFRGRLSLRHRGAEALEVIDARRTVECALLGVAMEAMDDSGLQAIEEAAARITELAESGEDTGEMEAEFHHRLFHPLGNELLSRLIDVFRDVNDRIQHGADNRVEDLDPLATAELYRQLCRLVAGGGSVGAAECLDRHFGGLRERISAMVGRPAGP